MRGCRAPAMDLSLSNKENGRRWVMTAVSIGTFASCLDSGMVSVSLPTLTVALSADLVTVGWVVMAYLLTATGLLLFAGRLSDLFGRRQVYLWGFGVFALGSALASLSPGIFWLIGARVVQACGAAALTANASALITDAYPEGQRGRVLGLLSAVVSAGLLAGPLVGGFFVELLGWRSVFYVNLFVGLVGIFICSRILRPEKRGEVASGLDLWGAVLLMVFTSSFILVFNQGWEKGWDSLYVQGLTFMAVSSFCAFVWKERKMVEPLIDLSLFKHTTLSLVLTSSFFYYSMIIANSFLMPFYLQQVLNYQPFQVGLITFPLFLTVMLVAPVSGRLSDRIGSRIPMMAGIIIASVAFILYARLDGNCTLLDILWRQVLLGAGTGLFSSPNHNAVMGMAPRDKAGVVSSLLALFRNLGFSFGVAVASSTVAARLLLYQSAMGPGFKELPFLLSLRDAWWVATAFGILATLILAMGTKGWDWPARPAL